MHVTPCKVDWWGVGYSNLWQTPTAYHVLNQSFTVQHMRAASVSVALQDQFVVVEDPALRQTSTGYNVLVQQLELVVLTRNAILRDLQ